MSEIIPPQGRCHEQHQVTVRVTVRCEREYGHGGAHTAITADTDFHYVISWWPNLPAKDPPEWSVDFDALYEKREASR